MNTEKIEADGEVIALILRHGEKGEGVHFITPDTYPLQVGALFHRKGVVIKPHMHTKRKRVIEIAQEVLHIDTGEVEVDLYASDGRKMETVTLYEGDTIFFAGGGHGLRILKDCRIIEAKQGPYMGVETEKIMLSDSHENSRK